MVGLWTATTLVMSILLGAQERAREPRPEVISAQMVTHSPLTIKPCQRVNIHVELEVDRPLSLTDWRRVVRSISQVVLVNGEEFRNILTDSSSASNQAALFELSKPRRGLKRNDELEDTSRAQVVVEFFLNMRDRGYLFTEARPYYIEFKAGDHVIELEVNVEEPTPQEREIIDSIDEFPVMAFLMGASDNKYRTPEIVGLVESAARKDTDYKKMLSIAVGLGKPPPPRPENFTLEEWERTKIKYMRERFAWLNPHCTGEINSPLEATATYKCGLAAGGLGSVETDEKKAKQYRARQGELWRKVAASPYAIDEGPLAKDHLAKFPEQFKADPPTKP